MNISKYMVALCGSIFLASCATSQTNSSEQDVLATLESWNQGWAERDAELAVQDYADDIDWTNAFGDRHQGKDALLDALTFIFGLDFVMAGESEGNEYQEVRFLSEDIALIRSKLTRTGQQFRNGEVRPDRVIDHLRVLERRYGDWVIVSHLISQAEQRR